MSHPDQIAGYLARVEAIEGISHTIIPVGKGLSVAYLPNLTADGMGRSRERP